MMRTGPADVADTAGRDALRDLIGQSEASGAVRRAVLLHTDRLPPPLARPHHILLARQAVRSLAAADHARCYELPRGRLAIVWRGAAEAELALVRTALGHLLSGQPYGQAPAIGELLTLYDLPAQAAFLREALDDRPEPASIPVLGIPPIDVKLLTRLEAGLAQAELSHFVRWRPVMALPAGDTGPVWEKRAWEERVFAVDQLATVLCPGRDLKGDPWLFRRLTRTLDRRMLAMLATPRELRGRGTFAINLNVASIVSPEFLHFDEALPVALRGHVVVNLRAADILSDPASFAFARDFALARCYRLALAGATQGVLGFLDLAAAGISVVKLACQSVDRSSFHKLLSALRPEIAVVLTGLDSAADVDWATREGVRLGQGRAVSQ